MAASQADIPEGYERFEVMVRSVVGPGSIWLLLCTGCGSSVVESDRFAEVHNKVCPGRNYVCKTCISLVPRYMKQQHEREERLSSKAKHATGWSAGAQGRSS